MAQASQKLACSSECSTGTGTILVVEDDVAVLDSLHFLVESLGYSALKAENGAQALLLVEQADDIDVLLTDLVLRVGMNGLELAGTIQRARPTAKILFMSGYSEREAVVSEASESGIRLLRKPFHRDELASAITETLGSRNGNNLHLPKDL